MGASQSSDTSSNQTTQTLKTSYYDLLSISHSATEDEIKKAYRRKALELHPDRNYGNEEAATKTFAEVQAAYQVLSDPHERAWYDSHESAILRGGDGYGDGEGGDDGFGGGAPMYENVRVTTADELAGLVRKFHGGVEYSDDEKSGFYGFIRATFEHLALEEEVAARMDSANSKNDIDYPSFGHKSSPYTPTVKTFYAGWQNFSSVKTFAWKDKYRLSDAPDRWTRRRMEQENRALRTDARREFNEAVRALVAFVRKRDPRYTPSQQTEEERQKALREAARAQAERARRGNAEILMKKEEEVVPEWARRGDEDGEEGGAGGEWDDGEDEEEDEDDEIQVLECVACDKTFKSESQWLAHERSKKHQKAMFALRKKMKKENKNFDLDSDGVRGASGVSTPDVEDVEDGDAVDDVEEDLLDDDEAAEAEDQQGTQENGHTLDQDEEEVIEPPVEDRDPDDDASSDAAEDDELESKEEETAAAKQQADLPSEDDDSASTSDSDYASPSTIASRLNATTLNPSENSTPVTTADPTITLTSDNDDDNDERNANNDPSNEIPGKKLGKAAQKRAKKAAAAAADASEKESQGYKCGSCQAGFPSKTRLFQHIRDHGHATLKTGGGGGGGGAKGKKKGKR